MWVVRYCLDFYPLVFDLEETSDVFTIITGPYELCGSGLQGPWLVVLKEVELWRGRHYKHFIREVNSHFWA